MVKDDSFLAASMGSGLSEATLLFSWAKTNARTNESIWTRKTTTQKYMHVVASTSHGTHSASYTTAQAACAWWTQKIQLP